MDNDIRKYKAGELTPAERHALEKRALSDPFLADALAGTEELSAEEFKHDVEKIDQQIIPRKKVFFTPLRIAAGVIIIVTATWTSLYLVNQSDYSTLSEKSPGNESGGGDSIASTGPSSTKDQQSEKLLSLKKDGEEKKEEIKNERIPSATQPTVVARDADDSDDTAAKPAETAEEQETEIAEDQIAQRRTEVTDTLLRSLAQTSPTTGQTRAEQLEEAKVAAGERAELDVKSDEGRMSKAAPTAAKKSISMPSNIISGKVTLAEDNMGVPGVNVRVKGTSAGTVTDLNGNYSIEVNDKQPTLVFSFIGLQTQEATPASSGTLNVQLTEDVSQLSEVVVTGRSVPADLSGDPVVRLAEPVGGIRAYDNYLENNLRYPQMALDNNIKGKVGIQFTVGTDGALNEFKVTKSLGFGCDEEVIRLVKEGPAWIPSSENNVPVESVVRVRMRFDPSKRK